MSKYGSCSLCGEEILEADLRDLHEQSVGWFLRRRGGKGGQKGKFNHLSGAVAHGRCVDEADRKKKAGLPVQQKGLF